MRTRTSLAAALLTAFLLMAASVSLADETNAPAQPTGKSPDAVMQMGKMSAADRKAAAERNRVRKQLHESKKKQNPHQ